ncbi:MAG: tetratricopeptide repeat protein [Candidatus Sumerlaeota bacterium]|nr:tetratricopeptide repeat protein [Candidatus Sumerlaeota bacterium]
MNFSCLRVMLRTSLIRYLGLATAAMLLAACMGCSKKTPEQKFAEIQRYLQNEDPFTAILKCQDFLKEHPNAPEADSVRFILAKCKYREKDFVQTHKYLQEVYERNGIYTPTGFSAYVGRMSIMMQEGKTTEAITMGKAKLKDLESVSTATEPLKSMRSIIAGYEIATGAKDEGRAIFKDLIEKTTDTREALQWAFEISASYHKDNQTTQAIESYCWLLDRFPKLESDLQTTSTWIPGNLAGKPLPPSFNLKNLASQQLVQYLEANVRMYASKKDFENAINIYHQYLKRYPDSILKRQLSIGTAFYLNELGRKAEAEAKYQEAFKSLDEEIAKTPGARDKGDLVLEKYRLYMLKKDTESAIKVCKEYLEKYPASEAQGKMIDVILKTYVENNEFDAALAYATEVQSKSTDQKIAETARQRIEDIKKMKVRKEQQDAQAKKDAATSKSLSGGPTSGSLAPGAPRTPASSDTAAPRGK